MPLLNIVIVSCKKMIKQTLRQQIVGIAILYNGRYLSIKEEILSNTERIANPSEARLLLRSKRVDNFSLINSCKE